jgi:ligand-binding SRPBCC domain-containing protein
MRYTHRFTVRAPRQAVSDFHRSAASLKAITPPPLVMRLHAAPSRIDEGDETDFTLWMGPLPVRWVARIEDVSPEGFVDHQLRGPFGAWRHHHHFIAVDATTTEVYDEVTATLHPALGWKLVGLGMWLGLPLLFAYRAWRTKKLLER